MRRPAQNRVVMRCRLFLNASDSFALHDLEPDQPRSPGRPLWNTAEQRRRTFLRSVLASSPGAICRLVPSPACCKIVGLHGRVATLYIPPGFETSHWGKLRRLSGRIGPLSPNALARPAEQTDAEQFAGLQG